MDDSVLGGEMEIVTPCFLDAIVNGNKHKQI